MDDQRVPLSSRLATLGTFIRECLAVIDKHGVGTVFAVDENARLVGVVGERDIRKALVGGAKLDDSVRQLVGDPATTVTTTHGRAEVLDVMRALTIGEVPVDDGEGHVVGLHVHDETIGSKPLENRAVVMAGGSGTRLAALTENIQNRVLPVAGRPIFGRIVLRLLRPGISRNFLSVNYPENFIEQYFGDGSKYGCYIDYLREEPDRPLGTGGELGLLDAMGERPTAHVLVMNGDLSTRFSLVEMLAAQGAEGVVATIATSEDRHQVPLRCAGPTVNGWCASWRREHHPGRSIPASTSWIRRCRPVLRAMSYSLSSMFDDCLFRNHPIGLRALRDQWQDTGRTNELAQARGKW